jgi:RNA polymerase sigma-70 factor (ECF subfamily)
LSQEYIKDKTSKLVELCKVGNPVAQREIYNLYVKAMYNTALRIVGEREEAEDVIQESFLDGFLKIEMFRGESTFGAWLKSIVVNKSIAKLRSRKMVVEEIDDRMESTLIDDNDEDFEDKLEMIDKVKKAINSLPNGFRLVLNLYLFEGYDHQEIGGILGISEVTSRSQYIRGKSKLLELLKVTQ